MQSVLSAALCELERNRPAVLVSIVESQGSTPRSAGAVMLVGEPGLLAGTIGGGILEAKSIERAGGLLGSSCGCMERYALNNEQAGSLGMICGGSAQMLFTPLKHAQTLRSALEIAKMRESGWLCLPLDGTEPLTVQAAEFPPRPEIVMYEGKQVLALRLAEAGRIFLFGGGHVSLELSRLLTQLDRRHLVIDDRVEFCSPERFPNAEHIFTAPFCRLNTVLYGDLLPNEQDAVCIMTRGHLGDAEAVRFALNTGAGYIGLMGSRSKRAKVFAQLEAEGFSEVPQRVHSPIGLAIGAQTPAEIAVSIAAQLIEWKQKGAVR